MKKFKWITGSILSLGMVAALALPVYAQEPTARSAMDSAIPSQFISYQTAVNTNTRHKDNKSYVYLKNDSGFNLRVVVNAPNGKNCMTNHPEDSDGHKAYSIIPTGEYFLTNYVKENFYDFCYLNLKTTGASGYMHGLWSPDSVGSYPIINPIS